METSTSRKESPWVFLLGLVAFVAALVWWVGWALPLVLAAIVIMVMGHEFGHFVSAKRAGMRVSDFFVGFGPVLWSTTRGETRYGVRALLLGGYVKVPGMTWSDVIDPKDEPRTYRSASYPRKVIFASAGSAMHVLMALVLAWASLVFIGLPSASHVGVLAFTPWSGHKENAAQLAGMKIGDRIVAVDGRTMTNVNQLVHLVHDSVGKTLSIEVERGGRDLTLHARPVNGSTIRVNGAPLSSGPRPQGYLGIEVGPLTITQSPVGAISHSFGEVTSTIGVAIRGIVHVFSPAEFSSLFHQVASPAAAENPKNQLTRPQSIVGVVRVAVQGAQAGTGTLIAVLIAVNLFVGVLNMIPMLPLDGGYVAIATYERLRSRRGVRYHADVNRLAPVIYAFMSVLLVLFLSTLYLDIVHPIANPFG